MFFALNHFMISLYSSSFYEDRFSSSSTDIEKHYSVINNILF